MKTVFLKEWRERLSYGDSINNRELARTWMTCATGDRVFQEFGRRSENYFQDLSDEARDLGGRFTKAVLASDIPLAQKLLELIEDLPSLWAWDYVEPKQPEVKPKKTRKTKAKKLPKTRKPRA